MQGLGPHAARHDNSRRWIDCCEICQMFHHSESGTLDTSRPGRRGSLHCLQSGWRGGSGLDARPGAVLDRRQRWGSSKKEGPSGPAKRGSQP